jgi:co-chaperonin GroES (HSP10)
MKLRPCNRYLHISLIEEEKQEEPQTAVLLPQEYVQQTQQRYRKANLVGVGSGCTSFSEQDELTTVLVVDTTMLESFVDSNGEKQLFILENHIMACYT